VIEPLLLRHLLAFRVDGQWRRLRRPYGPPTPRQLARLNEAGALVVVVPGSAPPVSKGQAAYAIDLTTRGGDSRARPAHPARSLGDYMEGGPGT
jgi:hypothetical protein